METKIILNDNKNKSQNKTESPHDAESTPVRFDVRHWHSGMSKKTYVDVMSLAIDKIMNPSETEIDSHEADMALMGKQHLAVQGLKCQNGCQKYATERVLSTLSNGMPVDLLVCEECAFGGVE